MRLQKEDLGEGGADSQGESFPNPKLPGALDIL
jgi:hypothetical protein